MYKNNIIAYLHLKSVSHLRLNICAKKKLSEKVAKGCAIRGALIACCEERESWVDYMSLSIRKIESEIW